MELNYLVEMRMAKGAFSIRSLLVSFCYLVSNFFLVEHYMMKMDIIKYYCISHQYIHLLTINKTITFLLNQKY